MSTPHAVLWHLNADLEAGGFRWGRSDSEFVAEWAGVLRLRADSRGQLTSLEAAAGARSDLVEKVRNGPAAAFLRVLSGAHSLHASAVAVGRAAALFVGPSGMGKSTVAACLCTPAGLEMLADDIVGLEVEGAEWRAVPSESVFWLEAGTKNKQPLRCAGRASLAAKVRWVFSLRFDDDLAEPTFRRLRGAEAASALLGAMVRFEAQPAVWRRELDVVDQLLRQAHVYELSRPQAVTADAVARATHRRLHEGIS